MHSVASVMAALFIVSLLIVFLQRGIGGTSSNAIDTRGQPDTSRQQFTAYVCNSKPEVKLSSWGLSLTRVTLPCAHSSVFSLPTRLHQPGEHSGGFRSSHQVSSCTFETLLCSQEQL